MSGWIICQYRQPSHRQATGRRKQVLAEREWPGNCLRIGKLLIGVQDLRLRCIMTAYDPDTLVRDEKITRGIYRRFGGKLALNCFVIEGGEITVGDEVQLERVRPQYY